MNRTAAVKIPIAAYDLSEGWHMDDDSQVDSFHIEFTAEPYSKDILIRATGEWKFWADHKVSGKSENDSKSVEMSRTVIPDPYYIKRALEDIAKALNGSLKKNYSANNWVPPGKRTRLNDRGFQLATVLRRTGSMDMILEVMSGVEMTASNSRRIAMNREAVANELIAIAEELVATTGTFKCPECGGKVLENTGYCVKCEKKVKKADRWYDMPEGWDAGSREKFWDSLTGDATHKITKCIEQMTGKVSDPGAFCGALASRVGYR